MRKMIKIVGILIYIAVVMLSAASCNLKEVNEDNTSSELQGEGYATPNGGQIEEDTYMLEQVFMSQAIRSAIREIIGKESEITQQELDSIESLNLESAGIEDITGLDKLTNIKELNLSYNYIEDISVLYKLSNLEYLNLSDNMIENINPLAKLYKLKVLDLSYNNMTDLDDLKNLENLEVLRLSSCEKIKDFSPLASLVNLKELVFDPNGLDTSSLTNLNELEYLAIGYTEDSRYQELVFNNICNLNNLKKLCLYHTGYIDAKLLTNFSELKSLCMDVEIIVNSEKIGELVNLEELTIRYCYNYSDISSLSNLTNLVKLNLEFNNITDISPLRDLSNLKVLNISGNPIDDYTPVEELDLVELYK